MATPYGTESVWRVLRALGACALVIGLAAMLWATLYILGRDTSDAFGLGVALAMLPLPVYLAAVMWLDRFEPEPRSLLVAMFAWGAGTAFALAYTLNTAGTRVIGELRGSAVADIFLGSVSAPVVEETLKAVPLFALLALGRHQLDDILDGAVYASMVGLGFAVSENILYYGRAVDGEGLPEALSLFLLRGVWSPFIHPLFTTATAIGVAFAATRAGPRWRVAPLAGLLAAMVLHSLWNTAAGTGWLHVMYYVLFIPLVAGLALVLFLVRRQQAHVLADHLPLALGREARVVAELGSPQGRAALRRVARSRGGPAGRRTAVAYESAAVELAFLERRVARGHTHRTDDVRRRELRARILKLEDELRRSGVIPGA